MKKIFFILLFIPILFGCEVYETPSEPNLTGGQWIFQDYHITVISSISPVEIVYNDTICINAFGEQSYVSGGILMQQHYETTLKDRRFIKGETKWNFDDNNYTLYINGNTNERYPVVYPLYMRTEYTQMQVSNPDHGSKTNFTFFTDATGKNHPTKLTLVSPNIVSDLLLSNGMRDKAVTVQVTLIFTKN